jgi:hypothetical protein
MQYDALLDDIRAGLDSGQVEEADLRRLLARADRSTRPDVAGVLRAVGAIVFLFGLALVFGIGYDDYPYVVKLVGPFAFPALALAAAIGLHHRGRPRWEVELAGMVGYVALGLALLTAGAAADAGSGYGLAASAAAIAVVIAMHAAVRLVRLTSWGLSASLVAFTAFASDLGGFLTSGTAPWLLTAQFAFALAVGIALAHRNREAAANALRSAALLALLACSFGIGSAGFDSFGMWHIALTLAVAGTLVAAAAFDLPGLMWIGALDGLVWIGAISAAVGRSAGWGVAVMLGGAALVGLALLVARIRPIVAGTPARL